jgi:threonine dehydrogenase-like Zn-dependent dehydrogenase
MIALPKFSRACVVRRFGEPVRVEDVPVPREVEPGALLIRNRAASICGTDVHLARGELTLAVDLPVILGHEMVGEVVAMGAGADRDGTGADLRRGDRVIVTHTTCGQCFFCTVAAQPSLCEHRRAYMYENMEHPPHLLGGFSEYTYVLPEAGRVKVPDGVTDRLASIASCALRSVMQAYHTLGPLASTDSVVIQGVGPLGLLAASVARLRGARRVIAIGAPASRLALADAYGAHDVIDLGATTAAERLERVRALTEGRGADVVMEFAGHPSAFAEGIDLVRRGGRYVSTGQLGPGEATFVPSRITAKNLTVLGSFSGHVRSYWAALDFLERHRGALDFEAMVTNAYALSDINVALDRMEAMEEVKPVIDL